MNKYNIVIINIGALGDNLLATPLIRAMHSFYPASLITLVTSPEGYEILRTNPFIDNFLIISYKTSSFREKLNLCGKLNQIKPDMVFNLSEKIWGYIWAFVSCAKIRAGFTPGISQPVKSLLIAPLINYKVKLLNNQNNACKLHEAERYCLLLKTIGAEEKTGKLEIFTGETPHGALLPKDAIVIHLTQKWFKYGWEADDFINLVKNTAHNFNESPIIITYGKQEKNWGRDIIDKIMLLRVESYYISDIINFAEDLKNAKLLLSPDTGIIHIAASMGVPVIDIFEEKFFEHNRRRWHPWGTEYIIIKRKNKKTNKDKEEFFAQVLKAIKILDA